MTPKISIIGVGTVGQMLAYALAIKNIGDLVLLDINEGRAKGKALDLAQATPILGADSNILGTADFEDIKGSDIVVVTAGEASVPGESRDDLLGKNKKITKSIAKEIKKYAPDSIVITITNPLDPLTYLMLKTTGFPKNRVFGMGGLLDSSRLKFCLAETLGVSFKNVHAHVIGQHGAKMIPALSLATAGGRSVMDIISSQDKSDISENTCNAASTIINLLEYESTGFAPATALAKIVEIILKNAQEIVPCSVYLEGEYGLKDLCIGVPVVLGQNGVEKVWQVDLDGDETKQLSEAAEHIKKLITKL